MSAPSEARTPRHFHWAVAAAGWAWAAAALLPATNAGCGLVEMLVLGVTAAVFGGAWLWSTVSAPGVLRMPRLRWAWSLFPAAWLAVLTLGMTDYGLIARVWLCEDEMRRFAEAARARSKEVGISGQHDRQVGLFHVHRTAVGDGSEVNMVTARGFLDSYGVTYWPGGPEAALGSRWRHLYGPWYWYYDDF